MKWSAIVLFLIGCSTAPDLLHAPRAKSTATLTAANVSPDAGSQLTKASVFAADVTWSIENFQPAVAYYIEPMFASKQGNEATFSESTGFSDGYHVSAASGSTTIRYSVARELESAHLARPIRVWVFLMERTGKQTTEVIAQAGPFEYR